MTENRQTRKEVMPSSWKDFFIAVEQMRECQKEHKRTNGMSAAFAAQKCEKEVDAAIKQKRDEWTRQAQPGIFKGGAA